ncbi:MAG: sulfatase-like hydrolase/transferase, partial [Armatimonadota bacterium]
LMTGRYQQRFGHEFNTGPPPQGLEEHVGLPLTETTIADRLKAAGYTTGAVGKWHQGIASHFHPLKRGFDEFFGFLHGGHSYTDPGLGTFNPVLRGEEPVDEQEYLTDAFTREAVAFIDRHRDERFFLYLSYNAVHTPMQAPQKYLDRFPDIEDQKRRTYAAMLSAMDDGIGAVLGKLREHGLEDNTLLFFVDDNGGPENSNASINDPLRAGKGTMYEGGIRVPFMVQWPGRIAAGRVYDPPVIALDILPTAVAAAGGQLTRQDGIDGVNLLPHITGRRDAVPHRELFWRSGSNYAARRGKWKLVRRGDNPAELYDLAADIGETNDLAVANPKVVRQLTEALAQWESEMVEPRWPPPGRRRRQRKPQRDA